MDGRSLQKTVLNIGSRVFARDNKVGTTTQAMLASSGQIKRTGDTPAKNRLLTVAIIDAIGQKNPLKHCLK